MEIHIPPRYRILIEMKPYFEDPDYLLGLDDEELSIIYSEMRFFKYTPMDLLIE